MAHILLIEDSMAFALYATKCLVQDHTVRVVQTLADAQAALTDGTPVDAVLLDLGLPDSRDPRQTWESLKNVISTTPTIIVTGNPTTRSGDTVEIVGKDPLWRDDTLLGSLVKALLADETTQPGGGHG